VLSLLSVVIFQPCTRDFTCSLWSTVCFLFSLFVNILLVIFCSFVAHCKP